MHSKDGVAKIAWQRLHSNDCIAMTYNDLLVGKGGPEVGSVGSDQ